MLIFYTFYLEKPPNLWGGRVLRPFSYEVRPTRNLECHPVENVRKYKFQDENNKVLPLLLPVPISVKFKFKSAVSRLNGENVSKTPKKLYFAYEWNY